MRALAISDLDVHMAGSLPNRLQATATRLLGGVPASGVLGLGDYEAAIVPLTELLFTVAQLPRGCAVQFAHTHQPLAAATIGACAGTRFWNTGSWIHEPSLGSYDSYRDYLARAWPGTAVLIDTGTREPELIEMLADQNPLAGGDPQPGEMLRDEADAPEPRARRFAARARRESMRRRSVGEDRASSRR